MERLLTEDAIFIVDNGASTFIPLWSYIFENDVLDLLRASGRRMCVHTVVTGGQALGTRSKDSRASPTASPNEAWSYG
jgi:hypothetical protein